MMPKEQCLIIYLCFLYLIGIYIFLYGFFPERVISAHSSVEDLPERVDDLKLARRELYKQRTPRIVLMVIDALRYDFVDGPQSEQNMPYLSSQLRNNCLLKARVEPPTVTLPRIKALMTGAISSFYDVIANFGSEILKDDNIVSQAISSDLKVVFYGDDTWLKLFPNSFLRSEGTVSFYVSDFLEVDDNITRHIDHELEANDWEIMILHYLGLDHIGHIDGPFSPHVNPKLLELDGIIAKIDSGLKIKDPSNPGILVICGDHGMKDSGGHGGTSLSEVLVPLALLNYKCDPSFSHEEVKQVDLTPLLSILLGLPIPGGSVGKINMRMLSGLDRKTALYSLHYNTLRMFELFKTSNPISGIEHEITKGIQFYKNWVLSNYTNNDYYPAAIRFSNAQNEMSSVIIKNSISFDDYVLLIAVILILQVVLFILAYNAFLEFNFKQFSGQNFLIFLSFVGFHYFCCMINECDSKLCSITYKHVALVICLFAIVFYNILLISANFPYSKLWSRLRPDTIYIMLGLVFVLNLASLTSSSFIEEEHQFWYFAVTTLSLYLLPSRYLLFSLVLALQVFLRKLNQTGDKWAHLPDIGDWLNSTDHKHYLTIYYVIGLCFIYKCQRFKYKRKIVDYLDCVLAVGQLVAIFLQKIAVGTCTLGFVHKEASLGITEARVFWVLTSIRTAVFIYFYEKEPSKRNNEISDMILSSSICVLTLLSKAHNVFLFPSILLFSNAFSKVHPKCSYSQAFFHFCIGRLFYFYQGNSNSIANIDISAGYIGLEEYNLFITGLYVGLNMYSGHILSFVLLIKKLDIKDNLSAIKSFSTMLFVSAVTTLFYMVVVTFERYHLFIWSVFAPKLMFICTQAALISTLIFSTASFSLFFNTFNVTTKKII
ncbi:GPI ethanolamine phosphate transferase 2 [Cimex lectularius]|uniref:GPI ethanolamine phosphate transferase 2 C-terminal domain-containing protein n=1 Tax=Cimex lectularius TaxID=79782 RepID=A0A8I6SS40_CIMLE|nr:GPI ethanolamine phosphate transferase 2 [Cimex lectularius]